MKALYDTKHNCKPEKYPSYFPTENPSFSENITDNGEVGYPGIPTIFPWYTPRSSDAFLEKLLNISDIAVEKAEINGDGDVIITVRSTDEGTRCNKCGRDIRKPYGHGREIMLRHTSVFGRKAYIRICLPRYQCVHCEGSPVTTQKVAWYEQRSPHTTAYENHVLVRLIGGTVADVSIGENLGYEAVMGIIDRRIDTKVNWNETENIDTLGTDEISLKKGHRNFVTVVTSLTDGKLMILAVLPDREKKTVKKFFKSVPKRLRKKVRTVCSDMYEGFVNAAKEVFGKRTRIVVDRFHVARLYRDDLDGLRKKEMRRLKEELPKEEYGNLKGAMWALRKNPGKLKPEDTEVLEYLFGHSPELEAAYGLCQELTDIFDEDISKSEAKRRINIWKIRVELSDSDCYDSFLKTYEKWSEEITNYFADRRTSGFVEGLNNKIKVIKRRCYGILNVDHLFQRIFLDIRGYSLFAS